MFDVVALGELLIDFTPAGISPAGNELFERNPGGAPANVLAAVCKLGGTGAFLGKVGYDQFGHYLMQVLSQNRIEASGLKFSGDVNTTLAFVHLDGNGDRSFRFYRNPGADTTLSESDLEYRLIEDARIFHFGSLSMTDEPAKTATRKAVEYAKNKGKLISYDPNWRPLLWKDQKSAKEGMMIGLPYADILKVSETEMEFLTGETDLEAGSKVFQAMGIKLVAVTLGPEGCYYRCGKLAGHAATYDTKVVDTTGAGDAFLGGLLYRISHGNMDIDRMDQNVLENAIDFSNATGALCAAKRGAIPAMPDHTEVLRCIDAIPKYVIP